MGGRTAEKDTVLKYLMSGLSYDFWTNRYKFLEIGFIIVCCEQNVNQTRMKTDSLIFGFSENQHNIMNIIITIYANVLIIM